MCVPYLEDGRNRGVKDQLRPDRYFRQLTVFFGAVRIRTCQCCYTRVPEDQLQLPPRRAAKGLRGATLALTPGYDA